MLYKSQMIIPQHHHRNKKKQTKPAANLQPAANNRQSAEPVQPPVQPATTTPSQPNANNNSNQQVNLNSNDEDGVAVPPASVEPKNSIPEIADGSTVGHNGARLSNTSTTTTVTTLSTSTTTTATSGPATTSSSGAQQPQQQQTTTAQLENAGKEETSLTRRKSSSITASMPNSQSMELKNSQINLSVQEKSSQPAHPQKPTSIDIQPANTAPVSSSTAHRNSHGDDTESGQSTPTKRNINKMRREHKAAKTLGRFAGSFRSDFSAIHLLCLLSVLPCYTESAAC